MISPLCPDQVAGQPNQDALYRDSIFLVHGIFSLDYPQFYHIFCDIGENPYRKEGCNLRNLVLVLVIIGAINWGLIGFLQYDLVAAIFGGPFSTVSRTIYAIVGLSGLYAISFFFRRPGRKVATES